MSEQHHHALFFLPLVLLLLCHSTLGDSNEDKLRQLSNMAQRSPIITFNNAETYRKLVSEPGRNYSLFLLFTATNPRYNCGPCVALADEMKKFGVSYDAFFGSNYHSGTFLENPFFLVMLEPNDLMDIFQEYQFTTVPHFVYIPAGQKKVGKLRDDQFLRNPQTTQFDISDFINKKISVDVPIYQDPLERFAPMVFIAVALILVVRVARRYHDKLYSPMLWYLFALFTYMIVMAGVVYNRIRNPPFMDVQGGRMTLISPSPRTQYVAEGIIVAVVLGGAGVVFVALGDIVPRVSGAWKKRVIFWISTVFLFVILSVLNNIFHAKYHMSAFRLNWRLF